MKTWMFVIEVFGIFQVFSDAEALDKPAGVIRRPVKSEDCFENLTSLVDIRPPPFYLKI